MGEDREPLQFNDIPFDFGAVGDARPLEVRDALTACAWILADENHESGLAGQITARGPRPGTYWTLPLGLGFDEAVPDAFVLVDGDLKTLEGRGAPNPATRFHLWVYRARPDVHAIVHTHPPFASTLAAAAQPLVVAHMDATPLYDDCAFLPEWPGVPVADREGEIISAALGAKHAIMLANHGLLTAGRHVQEAAFLAVFMERAARMQVHAAALGGVKPVPAEEARAARDFLRRDGIVLQTFHYWMRRARRRRGLPATP
jgi:L-fuculose-phosphate aldolase